MIQLIDLSKSFKGKTVLVPLTLSLEREKTHVLLGSSGSGKSTILKLITNLLSPTTGEILIDGDNVALQAPAKLALKIGYVIQEGGLFPHLTAKENVSLVATTLKWSAKKIEGRIQELSELVGLENQLLIRYPRELSGGQRQRVGIMRALMLNPPLLLFDEPLGALDPIIRAELQEELKQIFNRLNKTVLLVTHDIAEAIFFGHTITLLNKGALIQHGSFEDFINTPKTPFVTRFINAQRQPIELMETG